MKKITLLLLLISFLSCVSNDETGIDERGTEEMIILSFTNDSQVAINNQNDLLFAFSESGDNLVFEYRFVGAQRDLVADDEFVETILFEIDPQTNSFSLENSELQTINAFYQQFCFCQQAGSIAIDNGTISGAKIDDDSWQISIDISFVIFGNPQSIIHSGVFRLTQP